MWIYTKNHLRRTGFSLRISSRANVSISGIELQFDWARDTSACIISRWYCRRELPSGHNNIRLWFDPLIQWDTHQLEEFEETGPGFVCSRHVVARFELGVRSRLADHFQLWYFCKCKRTQINNQLIRYITMQSQYLGDDRLHDGLVCGFKATLRCRNSHLHGNYTLYVNRSRWQGILFGAIN